jgi:hypothetical protein
MNSNVRKRKVTEPNDKSRGTLGNNQTAITIEKLAIM